MSKLIQITETSERDGNEICDWLCVCIWICVCAKFHTSTSFLYVISTAAEIHTETKPIGTHYHIKKIKIEKKERAREYENITTEKSNQKVHLMDVA